MSRQERDPGGGRDAGAVADLNPWVPIVSEAGRAVLALIVVLNVLNAFAIATNPQEGERHWFLLDGESNPTTWVSTLLLGAAALLAMVCRTVDVPSRALFWAVVAGALLAMSLDEVATVHERLGGSIADSLGDDGLAYLWVAPAALACVVVVGYLWRTRPGLPTATARWLLAGAGLFALGALGLELLIVITPWTYADWDTEALVMTSIEENLELAGVLVIARGLARHALAATVARS